MAKVYASYGINGYKTDFVTTSKKSMLEYQGNIAIYDLRIYNHLTLQQVELLSLAQAQFFESVMEENINAKLCK